MWIRIGFKSRFAGTLGEKREKAWHRFQYALVQEIHTESERWKRGPNLESMLPLFCRRCHKWEFQFAYHWLNCFHVWDQVQLPAFSVDHMAVSADSKTLSLACFTLNKTDRYTSSDRKQTTESSPELDRYWVVSLTPGTALLLLIDCIGKLSQIYSSTGMIALSSDVFLCLTEWYLRYLFGFNLKVQGL